MTQRKSLSIRLKHLIVPILTTLLILTSGCGWIKETALEKGKDVVSGAAENKAITLGVNLKTEYGIDVAKDTPQAQVMKIVSKEVASGNTELAKLLSDVSKVQTVGDAIAIVATYKSLISDKDKQGQLAKEGQEALERIAWALGSLGGVSGLGLVLSKLKNKTLRETLIYLAEKIEKTAAAGGTAKDVKTAAKTPLASELKPAATLAEIVKERFPGV